MGLMPAAEAPDAKRQPPASPAFSECSTALPSSPAPSTSTEVDAWLGASLSERAWSSPSIRHAAPFSDPIAGAVFEASSSAPPAPSPSAAPVASSPVAEAEAACPGPLAALTLTLVFTVWFSAGVVVFVASQCFTLFDFVVPISSWVRTFGKAHSSRSEVLDEFFDPVDEAVLEADVDPESAQDKAARFRPMKWTLIFVAWLFAGIVVFVVSQGFLFFDLLFSAGAACLDALMPRTAWTGQRWTLS